MGAFFDSVHVRIGEADTVRKALEQAAKEIDCKFLLGPSVNGWVSVFPSEIGRSEPVSAEVARFIPNDIFHLMVYDDDIFYYYFYRKGKLIDRYNSCPDYFEETSEEEVLESRGRPELLQDLLPKAKSPSKLKKLLAADKYTFESHRMVEFIELFEIPNALASYDNLQEGEHDEIEGWEQFIHIEYQPHSAEDYNRRGEVKLGKEHLDGALADFNKAIELNPNLASARDNRERAETAKKEWNKKNAQGLTIYAQQKRQMGELDSALTLFNKAIELDPESAIAYSSRGMLKRSAGDLDGALADLNKAIELKEDLPETYITRAATKNAKGDPDGALADYDRAIELKPDSSKAHNNRGELRRKKGNVDGALADYDRAIELKPDKAVYYSNRSLAKIKKRDLDGALADSARAIELKPDLAAAYNNRGMAKQVKGDLDGALEDYNKAISLDPKMEAFKINRDKAMQIKEGRKP